MTRQIQSFQVADVLLQSAQYALPMADSFKTPRMKLVKVRELTDRSRG